MILPTTGIGQSTFGDDPLASRPSLPAGRQRSARAGSLQGIACVFRKLFRAQIWQLDLDMRPSPRLILVIFILLQIFDGLLTYTAVGVLGVVEEGNHLLAVAMQIAGAGPALVGAKSVAACCGLLLYARGFYGVLGALTGLYMLGAITPWLYVFHNL